MIAEFFNPSLDTAATFAGGTVTIVWLLRILWRRLMKDGAEVAKDRAEINIIETLQTQISTLSAENKVLRTTEADIAIRLGRLEAKEKEAAEHMATITKLQRKLDEKDSKIEKMIAEHATEMTKMSMTLNIKENQITELYERIIELESRLKKDESCWDTKGNEK